MNVARFLEAHPEIEFDHCEYVRSTRFIERLERRMRAFVATRGRQSDEVVRPPPYSAPITSGADLPSLDDIDLAGHRILYKKRSTGTTGPRKTIYYSESFYFDELFLPLRKVAFAWGIEPRTDTITAASLSNQRAFKHLLLLDPTGTFGGILRLKFDERSVDSMGESFGHLARAQPLLIFSKPSVLAALATFVLQRGLQGALRPAVVLSSGGTLSIAARALIADALGCRVGEAYATSEAGCVGIACPEDGAYHVDETQVFVECDDRTSGRILTTMVANEVTPLTRFDTGDFGILLDGACSCGKLGPRLVDLRGKASEIIDLGDGRYFDLGRVNLDVLPGASEYRVDATADVIQVTARLTGPDRSSTRVSEFARDATNRISRLMPSDTRRLPDVLVRVE